MMIFSISGRTRDQIDIGEKKKLQLKIVQADYLSPKTKAGDHNAPPLLSYSRNVENGKTGLLIVSVIRTLGTISIEPVLVHHSGINVISSFENHFANFYLTLFRPYLRFRFLKW